MQPEFSVPVIVVGGGAAGAVAALSARCAGADVLLVERYAQATGTTAMSQGLVCAAGTRQQQALGIIDDADILLADIMAKTRGLADPVIARAVAQASGPTVDWLTDAMDYPFSLDTGARAAYGHSRQRLHGWLHHGGADMVQLLHARVAERGIDVLPSARLVALLCHGVSVSGIIVSRPDGREEAIGCGALILACGGFAANHDQVAAHMPEAASARHNGHEGNMGDGIWLAAAAGAALADMGSYQGYAMLADPHGITVPPGVLVEGGIIVNRHGQRFTNEVADIAGMVHPVLAQPDGVAWVVLDARIRALNDYIPETRALAETGAIRQAGDVAALAAMIGADPVVLAATLAATGGVDGLGRHWDGVQPPQPPYAAIRVCGAIYHTQGGVQIDGSARAMHRDGRRFANLLACGGAARGVSGPSYWGYLPAMGLGSAISMGRVAGLTAAALVQSRS